MLLSLVLFQASRAWIHFVYVDCSHSIQLYDVRKKAQHNSPQHKKTLTHEPLPRFGMYFIIYNIKQNYKN